MARGVHQNSLAALKNGRAANSHKARHSYGKLAEIIHRMMSGRFTRKQLTVACKISATSAFNWTEALRHADCIHIVDYATTRNGNAGAAVFAWGSGDDLPRPKGRSNAQRSQDLRKKRATLAGAWKGLSGV